MNIDKTDLTILAVARGICKRLSQDNYHSRSGGAADVLYSALTDLILTLGIEGADGYREALGIADCHSVKA